MPASSPSLVWASVEPRTEPDGDEIRATVIVPVEPGEPVFPGHFPGFPIFPGVCVVECVHRAVVAVALRRNVDVVLEAIEFSRFLGPAFPGDELRVELIMTEESGRWRVAASVLTARGDVARIRLRHRAAS